MNEILRTFLTFLAGILLGAIFFGGLWISTQRALRSKLPALWVAGSLISRLTITLLGFYFVCQKSFRQYALCLVGFLIARFIILWYTKIIEEKRSRINMEVASET
jgi:F1F0 ATPase subunit 2